MTLPVADAWFAVDERPAGIARVREHHVDSYAVGDIWLIRGTELSVAFDATSGLVPPGPFVAELTSTPVLCVVSTCGYDHAGGWASFDRRACHRADADALADPAAENAQVGDYLTIDRFDAIPTSDFRLSAYGMVPAAPTDTLIDGDQLDLGDRRLEVLHTPGRSPGGLSLWEAATGVLFSGEILYDGDHGPAWPPRDPIAYAASVRRLRELPVEVVYPGHYDWFGPDRMRELIDEQLADLSIR